MAADELSPAAAPAAIVLNGGSSRRMGTDKAALVLNGRTMLDRVLHAVDEAGISQVVVAGRGDVEDNDADQGPLGGIVAAWAHLQRHRHPDCQWDPVLVLACDLPMLDGATLTALVAAAGKSLHGAVAHDGVRAQPLVAAYRRLALDELAAAYDRGERSVRHCSVGWDLTAITADSAVIADADTPEDLRGFVVEWPV